MQAPTKVVLAFNPIAAKLLSFSTRTAKLIWCCIRKQHIVHQHFDRNVFEFAELLDKRMPKDYSEFKTRVDMSPLYVFGTKSTDHNSLHSHMTLDDEFWQGVWAYIKGEKELQIESEEPQ